MKVIQRQNFYKPCCEEEDVLTLEQRWEVFWYILGKNPTIQNLLLLWFNYWGLVLFFVRMLTYFSSVLKH